MSHPWDESEDLTPERIAIFRDAIVSSERSAGRMFGKRSIELPWSFGCTASELTMRAVATLAERHAWLHVCTKGLRYSAFVGGTMVKFRRSEKDPDWARFKKVDAEISELLFSPPPQLDAFGSDQGGCFWFFRPTRGDRRKLTGIELLRCHRRGEVHGRWLIPIDEDIVTLTGRAKQLPRPSIRLLKSDEEQDKG